MRLTFELGGAGDLRPSDRKYPKNNTPGKSPKNTIQLRNGMYIILYMYIPVPLTVHHRTQVTTAINIRQRQSFSIPITTLYVKSCSLFHEPSNVAHDQNAKSVLVPQMTRVRLGLEVNSAAPPRESAQNYTEKQAREKRTRS